MHRIEFQIRALPIALVSILVSVCFFAPQLWLMSEFHPGTFQWDRAHTYLLQVEDPFRDDIESVMRWRVLPPLVAHVLGLPGKTPLVIPWIGLIVMTAYVARVLQRHSSDFKFVFGGTLLFATTSAVIVPIHWFGINDPWVWLGLLVVSFERSPFAIAAACLLCPWVDERFIIGLPLAWTVRSFYFDEMIFSRQVIVPLAAIAPYFLIRMGITHYYRLDVEGTHLSRLLPQLLISAKYGYLGWWMGLRAAWAPIVFAIYAVRRPLVLAAVFAVTAAVTIILTEDQSRSAAVAVPVVILGLVLLQQKYPLAAARYAMLLGILGLLLPAAHVGNNSIMPYDNIVVEVYRLIRGLN